MKRAVGNELAIWRRSRCTDSIDLMSRSRHRPNSRLRVILAWLVLASLLPGWLEQHETNENGESFHSASAALSESLHFSAATHPDLPLHVEGAGDAETHHCLACLHSLQRRSAAPDHISIIPRPQILSAALLVVSIKASRRWAITRSGRAPPLS